MVDDDALGRETARYAGEIAAKSPAAVRLGKRMVNAQRAMPLDDAYAYAGDVMARNMNEDDARDGIEAFLAKRGSGPKSGGAGRP